MDINESKNFEYTRIGSGIEIKKYIGTATSVNIPSRIDNLNVTSIGENAFKECKSLTSIQISNSVITISEWAFLNCKSLTSVRLLNPNTIIGKNTFKGCNRARISRVPIAEPVVETPKITVNSYVSHEEKKPKKASLAILIPPKVA